MLAQKIAMFGLGLVIGLSLVFASWYVANGEIVFHSDIARDFSLLDNLVTTGKPTLLGPRSGAVDGLFHGPAWLYLNLPAFIVGHGNPVVVGWFWVILQIAYLGSVYYVAKRIFSPTVGLVSSTIIATRIPLFSHQMFNPSGAFLLFPLFFYFLWKFYNFERIKDLAIGSILAGFLIQFQMMFGIPMFICLIIIVVTKILKKSTNSTSLLTLLFIVLPLSSYIAFDLKHDFVQIKAILSHFTNAHQTSMSFFDLVSNRVVEIFKSVNLLSRANTIVQMGSALLFWICVIWGVRKHNKTGIFSLYLLMIFVFGIFSLVIAEPVKGYYFDFSSINSMILVAVLLSWNKFLPLFLITPLLLINLDEAMLTALSVQNYAGKVSSSWIFNRELGEVIAADAPSKFSVFTLDTDIWGYSPHYGISYAVKLAGRDVDFENKSEITYLVIAKNTIDHPLFDVRWWREDQIRIKKRPVKTWEYKEIFMIEKYYLTDDDLSIPVDPLTMSTNTSLR